MTSLSFGCMTTSDQSVVERAADLGIIHFDTARGYQNGNNERMLGAALKGRRKQAIVSSKSGGGPGAALDELDTSLRELGTDYLDIWYLHGKSSPAEVTDELLEAQRAPRRREDPVRRRQHALQHGPDAGPPGQAGTDRRRPDHLQLRDEERGHGRPARAAWT